MGGLVTTLIWSYIVVSLAFLFLVRQLRLYPLNLFKGLWVTFTIVVFLWVVMMSGATNEEFAHRPGGFFEEFQHYPSAFRHLYGIGWWWFPFLLFVPLWAVHGLLEKRRARQSVKGCLAVTAVVVLGPVVSLAIQYDWSPYGHFVESYRQAWQIARMGDYFLNSVLVSVCAVGLISIVGSLAAYGLTRLRFTGRRLVMTLLLAGLSVPGILLMVPLFVMMKDWAVGSFSFSNSRVGLAVIYTATALPFTTFLLAAFYRTLPGELAKAAVVDGAKPWHLFTEVYFPLSAPALATTAIFNFLAIWNEYHFALVFLTNPDYKTLSVGLYNLQVSQQYAVNWPAMFAGIVILCLPTFLIFVVLQERIVAGLTVGSVKG